MNLFNAFSFGRLIKTFLPGFLIFFGVCAYIDMFSEVILGAFILSNFAFKQPAIFIVILIPSSIILGVFSNIVFFTFATEFIIEKRHRSNESKFYEFETNILDNIKQDIIKNLKFDDIGDGFRDNIDIKAFLLNRIGIEKLAYLKDCYWYYLEFQLNILLAIDFIVPAIILYWLKTTNSHGVSLVANIGIILIILVLTSSINVLFINSARKNFYYYKRKYLSLVVGSYYFLDSKNETT